MARPSINRAWIVGDVDLAAFVKAFGLHYTAPQPSDVERVEYMATAQGFVIRDRKEVK